MPVFLFIIREKPIDKANTYSDNYNVDISDADRRKVILEKDNLGHTWEYKITGGAAGVILSFIMLAGFGYMVLWMYTNKSEVIILGKIVLLFAVIGFVLALYGFLFFRVYIGSSGFFYQSRPGNGRYYNYYEIQKAWISYGRNTNSNEMRYCHFETKEGKTVRFFYTEADEEAVLHFLKSVEAETCSGYDENLEVYQKYVVTGKVQGRQKIAIAVFIEGILLVLWISLSKYVMSSVEYIVPIALGLLCIGYLIMHYYFYKIEIGNSGFFCQTNPFNGKYYRYNEITECRIEERRRRKAYSHGGKMVYSYYLVFSERSGRERKILFDKALFEYEINTLVFRAELAQNMESMGAFVSKNIVHAEQSVKGRNNG